MRFKIENIILKIFIAIILYYQIKLFLNFFLKINKLTKFISIIYHIKYIITNKIEMKIIYYIS